MTVTEKSSRKIISGSGWVNPLTHDFMVENASYVHVFADDVELVNGVDYTVTDVNNPAGYAVTIAVPGDWAPVEWVLDARPPIAQGKDLTLGGQFGAKYEDGLDQLARRVQRVYDLARRGLKSALGAAVGDNPYTLPAPSADKLIGWNAAADDLENFDPVGIGIALVDNDVSLASDSATRVPSQHAVKTFATAGDATVAAAAAAAIALKLTKTSNLSDLSDAAQARKNILVPTTVTTRAALKALDTTKDTVVLFDGSQWLWTLGNFTAEVAADDQEGVTIKANAISAGTGAWVRQFLQPVPATCFGAFTGVALQEAIDYMSRKGGGEVYLPSGSANSLAAQVTVPTQVSIRGGKGSSITPTAAMTRMLLVQAGLTAVRGIRLENSGALATRGIEIDKGFNNAKVVIEDNYFSNFTDAVRWTDGDCLHFLGNEAVSNANAVYVANNCMNSHFEKNYILGGAGYNFNKTTQGVEGANICGDIILPGAGGLPAITFNCALDVQITGCILDQLYGSSGVNIIATTNPISGVKFLNNWVGRNLAAAGANYGLFVADGARNVQSAFNTYTGWQQAGIYFKGTSGAATKDCSSIGDNFYYADRCLRDILIDWSDNLLIDGDTFNGSGASIVEGAGTISGRVVNCNFAGSFKPTTITGGLKYGDQRAGMVLRNKGSTTVLAAGTAVVINHGLDYTPTLQDIRLICGTVTTNGSGDLAAVTIGATQFTITPRIAPGTNMAVGWVADLTR